MRFLLLLSLCLANLQKPKAQSFLKILNTPDGSAHYFKKMLPLNDEGYAIITSSYFHRIDKQGNITVQQNLSRNALYLIHFIPWQNETFLAIGDVAGGTSPIIRICQLSKDGIMIRQKDIQLTDNYNMAQLVAGPAQHFYLVFKHIESQESHPDVLYFNENMDLLWTKEMAGDVDHELFATQGTNGNVELLYMIKGSRAIKHQIIEPSANMSEQPLQYQAPQNTTSVIRKLTRTPDGGYLYTGTEMAADKNEDIFVIKTDAQGTTQWEKRIDLYLGERCEDISCIDNSYLLLTMNGLTKTDYFRKKADIGLIRLDELGNIQWAKSYGTDKVDNAINLLTDKSGNILIGGQCTVTYDILPEPVIIKTNPEGIIEQDEFPKSLLRPTQLQTLNPDVTSQVQRQADAYPLQDGGMLIFSSILQKATDEFRPSLCRTNKEGNTIWNKIAPGGSDIELMRKLPDGGCITISWEAQFMAVNGFTITRWDADGNTQWSKQLFTTHIKDLISTDDDGFLLTGAEAENLGNEVIKLWVLKLNQQGNEEWKFTHRMGNKWITGKSLQLTPEKDILIAGSIQDAQVATTASFIAKLSSGGQLKWMQSYAEGNFIASHAEKILITKNNEYLATGYVKYLDLNKQDILLLKTNASGNLLWKKQYNIDKLDAGLALLESGTDYIIAGNAGQRAFGPKESFGFLMKTDLNGNQTGLHCFGENGTRLTATNIYAIAANKILFTGTVETSFGHERPFITILNTDNLPAPSPADKKIRIYPVPAVRNIMIQIDHPYEGNIRLSIYGTNGQKYYRSTLIKNKGSVTLPVQLPGLPAGNYFAELIIDKERIIQKLQIGSER